MCSKLTYVVSCVTLLALAGSASADLVGHWRLDDGSGAIAADSSGNGHDGELIGNPQWVTGVYGGALEFAGTPDKVDIPYSDQLNPEGEFSVSVWANVDPGGSGHRSPITSRDDYPQRGYIIYCEPGNTWQFWTGSAAGQWNNAAGPAVNLGEWTHLAITYDNGDKKLYVNGEVGGESSDEMAINTAQVLRIGAGATEGDGNYFFVGMIDDAAVFDHALTEAEVLSAMAGIAPAELAADPSPADATVDVPRETPLAWVGGEFAATHDVYLGTVFDDVNDASRANPMDVLVSEGQADVTYDAGRLAFGQTYYWRIDEVNGAPDNTIFKGEVWSFTVEPLAYSITGLNVTSNGVSEAGAGPENTINGSGLDAADQHSVATEDMWLARPDAQVPDPVYIQYEFDAVYKLHEMLIWNYNSQFEPMLGFGIKDATVEYSEDGEAWTVLGDVTFNQAAANATYTANTTVEFGGVAAQAVRITVNSGYGPLGQYGLSEVRFLYIPVQAREPQPADGAVAVSVDMEMSWRAGREAVSHDVYLGTDAEALPLADTIAETSYIPGALDLATTYYWQIDEVNETEAIDTWQGHLWSFSTEDFIVVDDFESYNDDDNRIYEVWLDGWVNDTGSTVGHLDAPFAETTIVYSGSQSMSLFYDNSEVATSEADLELSQDWTSSGIKSLSLYFHGDAENSGGQLYVEVNGTKIAYDGDAADITLAAWQVWNIDLSTVGNVSNVSQLTIGIEGAGATGVVYIDDVRLYPKTPEYITPTEPGTDGLVAYYALDGNANDGSGNGNNGTLNGDVAFAAGVEGQALDCDGVDDYVSTGKSATDLGIAGNGPRTVTVWVYTRSFGNGGIYDVGARTTAQDFCLRTYDNIENRWRIQYWGGDFDFTYDTVDKWVHFTHVHDGAYTKIYANGVLIVDWEKTIDTSDTNPFQIGLYGWPGDFFDGLIDELYLYNRALSAEEALGAAGQTVPRHKPF